MGYFLEARIAGKGLISEAILVMLESMQKKTILFVCTHGICASREMREIFTGYLKKHGLSERYDVYNCGLYQHDYSSNMPRLINLKDMDFIVTTPEMAGCIRTWAGIEKVKAKKITLPNMLKSGKGRWAHTLLSIITQKDKSRPPFSPAGEVAKGGKQIKQKTPRMRTKPNLHHF